MPKGFQKGHIPWNKNKPWLKEIIEKMKLAKLGYKHTEEWKIKMKGKHHSLATEFKKGQHCSIKTEFKNGQITWNKGLNKKTDKRIDRLSKIMKGKHNSLETEFKGGKPRPEMIGENNNRWKGGITPENKKIRCSLDSKLWREAVFERDNWICQKYRIKGGKLHPHHVQNFAQFPELRFAIDNGITLSEKAHREFHKKYGIKNNTKEQLIEFLKD